MKHINFTPREKIILRLLKKGYTNPQIAERLSVSVYTINSHMANMRKKARVNNRTQLALVKYIEA
jgi:DNA-binding CsgD family transcriptional regulator